jgi:uncharacterized protein (DUF302 family)
MTSVSMEPTRVSNEARSAEQTMTRRSAVGAGIALILVAFDPAALDGLVLDGSLRRAHSHTKNGHPVTQDNGIITVPSRHSVDETVAAVETILHSKGIKLFTIIDHSGEAKAAGLPMRPTKLLIFGNPQAGTPLMVAAPSIALDLPLKLLVWEDAGGNAWLSYNAPAYLQSRHELPEQLVPVLAGVVQLANRAAG